jgi:hypothetical protein
MKQAKTLGLIILLVCCGLTGTLFLYSLLLPDSIQIKTVSGEFKQLGDLDFHAKLKKNLIYEKDEINKEYTLYSSLLESMNLTYRYSASPAENISGEYAITLKLSPVKGGWEKEISKFENRINGPFELQIPLDWNRILSDWKQIEKETNYDFGDPNIKFQAYIRISDPFGKRQEFLQESNITYGKTIAISGSTKEGKEVYYTTTTVSNKIGFFGSKIESQTLKLAFGTLFFSLIFPTSFLALRKRRNFSDYLRKRKIRVFERKFKNKIVSLAEEVNFNNAIKVKDLKDLGKISYELEKPIVKAKEKYAVIDGETVYLYDNNNNNIKEKI